MNTSTPPKAYYSRKYDKLYRYILYYYQILYAEQLNPENILDIGVGNKTVAEQLIKHGYNVTTCDYDKNLDPDYVGDVRNLPFDDKKFDVAIACEVLEHLPFFDFEKSLIELARVSKKRVVISMPYYGLFIGGNFHINIKMRKFNIFKYKSIFLRMPYFYSKIDINKNKRHYWEIGASGCSKSKIRKIISKYFTIENEFHVPYSQRHFFYILKPLI